MNENESTVRWIRDGRDQLIQRDLRTLWIEHEPPCVAKYSCRSDVCAYDHISEEQPSTHKRFAATARGSSHNVVIRWVERQRRCGQTIYGQNNS